MPNWTGSVNKTSQGLVRGISFSDSKQNVSKYRVSSGSTGWKEALDSTGSGLLRGLPIKKEKTEKTPVYTSVSLNSTWREDPYATWSPAGVHNNAKSNVTIGAITMVHDIPCFDLPPPPPPKDTNYPEATLLERVRGNRTLKARKKINISLPLEVLTAEDKQQSNVSPVESQGNVGDISYTFVNHGKRPSLRLEVSTSRPQSVVRDASATDRRMHTPKEQGSNFTVHCRFCGCNLLSDSDLCVHLERCGCGHVQYSTSGMVAAKMSSSHPSDADFAYCCPASKYLISPMSLMSTPTSMFGTINTPVDFEFSPISPRRKSRYPSMTKIPEDLPRHERYTSISRSRSTRVIESQKSLTPNICSGEDSLKYDGRDSVESDASSVYSQDYHIDSPPVEVYKHE